MLVCLYKDAGTLVVYAGTQEEKKAEEIRARKESFEPICSNDGPEEKMAQ